MKPIILTILATTLILASCKDSKVKQNQSVFDTSFKQKDLPLKTSNNCADYLITQEDKMTGKTTTSGNPIIISDDGGKTGFEIILMKTVPNIKNQKPDLIFHVTVTGGGNCIDDAAKMNILFTDTTRIELYNMGKFNCDDSWVNYMGGFIGGKRNGELDVLRTKEIQAMRIWTLKSFVEMNFTKQNSIDFLKTINCVMN